MAGSWHNSVFFIDAFFDIFGWIGVFFGILAGIILYVYGGRRAKGFACSLCKEKIGKGARVCPHCNAVLDGKFTRGFEAN